MSPYSVPVCPWCGMPSRMHPDTHREWMTAHMACGSEIYPPGATTPSHQSDACKRIAALRDKLDLVHGAIRADDDRLYAAWVRIHGAPDDCANIGCDAPEWMADEILRLRAELERTKEELERVRRNHLRRMHRDALEWADRMIWNTPDEWVMRNRPRLLALASSIRAALERKDGA